MSTGHPGHPSPFWRTDEDVNDTHAWHAQCTCEWTAGPGTLDEMNRLYLTHHDVIPTENPDASS